MLLFRQVDKNASKIGYYIDHEKKVLILFKNNESIAPQIPICIKGIISIHTPNAADAPGVLGAIPPHVRTLYLYTLPSAADAPAVLGAIPPHVLRLVLNTLPSAADAQTYKNAIPFGIVHNIP